MTAPARWRPPRSWRTARQVRGRGFEPVRWHTEDRGFVTGWIERRGRKWVVFVRATGERRRVRVEELRHMEPLQ